jgi:tol-pal system protein YbgF
MLDLVNQIEALRRELAEVRGQNERLARDVADLQRQQRDVSGAIDERLRPLEPVKVTLEGQEFTAKPEEKAAFEAAMTTLRAANFPAAAQQYTQFLTRYPSSGYVPVVLYWLGNAQYANRSYKPAIDSYQRLLAQFPQHARAPEALLAVANCHLELKDARSAKATLQNVVKTYPASEAASAAKDRLARLR